MPVTIMAKIAGARVPRRRASELKRSTQYLPPELVHAVESAGLCRQLPHNVLGGEYGFKV